MNSEIQPSTLLAEQIRQIYAAVNPALAAMVVNGVVLVAVLWPVVEHHKLLTWLLLLVLVVLGCRALVWQNNRTAPDDELAGFWYRRFLLGSTLSALIWSVAIIWLFPIDDLARQVFLVLVIGGMAGATLISLSYLRLAVFPCLWLTLLPLLVQFLGGDSQLEMMMAAMIGFYLLMLSIAAERNYQQLKQNIRFRIDAIDYRQSLEQSEQRYKTLLETATDAFFLHDMQGRFVDVNQQACRSLGYSREELLGLSVIDVEVGANPEKLSIVWPKLQQVVNIQQDCVHRRKDGSTFPVEVRAGVIQVHDEYLVSVLVRDITERRRTEEVLRESKQKMTLHLQHTPLGVIECDNDSCITEWNPAAEKIFGFTKAEVFGCDVRQLIIPDEAKAGVYKVWDKVLASGNGQHSVNDNKTKRGHLINCEWYNTPLVDNSGKIIGVASLVQDITNQLKAQQKLAESESSYRTLFELSDEAIMTLEKEGLVDCNQATLKLFGYNKKSEFLNRHPSDMSPPFQPNGQSSRDGAEQIIEAVYREGKNRIEWVHRRANGDDFAAEVLLTPMKLQGREVLQAIVRDVTEQKAAEAKLLAAKREAERSNLAKSEFLSRMSHELRTPLNAILGFGQLLELSPQNLSETQKINVSQLLAAGYHLLDLINGLLDMAAIESGKLDLLLEPVYMDVLIERVMPLIRCQVEERQLQLVEQISGKGLVVQADARRLKQVLLNLLSNAVKYNSENGHIMLDCEVVEQQRLRIRITDTGPGLTEAEIAQLFVPFVRLGGVSHVEGTGIGLTISKELIERMGGSIGVNSNVGEGCSFWLEIKLQSSLSKGVVNNGAVNAVLGTFGTFSTLSNER